MKNQPSAIHAMLKTRFEANPGRHKKISWADVEKKLIKNAKAIKSLEAMEATGGEPDVIDADSKTGQFLFADCSAETPTDRRSLCYDKEGWLSRKEHRPVSSAMEIGRAHV